MVPLQARLPLFHPLAHTMSYSQWLCQMPTFGHMLKKLQLMSLKCPIHITQQLEWSSALSLSSWPPITSQPLKESFSLSDASWHLSSQTTIHTTLFRVPRNHDYGLVRRLWVSTIHLISFCYKEISQVVRIVQLRIVYHQLHWWNSKLYWKLRSWFTFFHHEANKKKASNAYENSLCSTSLSKFASSSSIYFILLQMKTIWQS
jgi:hypothetical protein